METSKVQEKAFEVCSWTSLYRVLYGVGTPNARTLRKFREKYEGLLDVSHFTKNGKRRKYNIEEKLCPVCDSVFETKIGSKEERTTCSYGCSNIYFRSGEDNGNFKGNNYRTICFHHHEKECVVCGEDLIVEVHHYDENSKNNSPENLIPLCPTHHQYWHSRYRYLVKPSVDEYLENFKRK